MSFPDRNDCKNRKNPKKIHNNQSRSKSKTSKTSKSKSKGSFLSPKGSNSNYGIKSYK